MSSLSFLLIAALVGLATGCPRDGGEGVANAAPPPAVTPAQVPSDGAVLGDALSRDAITRDATPVQLDGGPKGPL
jgi:hypothetical protein